MGAGHRRAPPRQPWTRPPGASRQTTRGGLLPARGTRRPRDVSVPRCACFGAEVTSVALVHDYLTQRGGAERVVLSMLKAFPDSVLYTSLYLPDGTFPEFRWADVRPLTLDRIPALRHHHRAALPL